MKAKLKLLELGLIVVAIIINVYLIGLNTKVNNYKSKNEIRSTANYVVVETEKEQLTEKSEEPVVEDEVVETIEPVVYDGKTLSELATLLDKSLSSTISGKGHLIASYSVEKGVDPYMATAIILQETGCKWGCSYLVRECNNVGGQKGTGCGSYSYFNSLDEGIMAFIDNLYRNYISYGLTTPETINPKYAEDTNWHVNVNKYIEIIKAQ